MNKLVVQSNPMHGQRCTGKEEPHHKKNASESETDNEISNPIVTYTLTLQKILGEGAGGIKKIRTATTFPETANGSGLGTADATKGEFLHH
jgi:hypothetical protein